MPKTKYAGKRKRTYKRKSTSVVKKLVKKVNKLYRGIETKHSRTSGLGALPDNDPTLLSTLMQQYLKVQETTLLELATRLLPVP